MHGTQHNNTLWLPVGVAGGRHTTTRAIKREPKSNARSHRIACGRDRPTISLVLPLDSKSESAHAADRPDHTNPTQPNRAHTPPGPTHVRAACGCGPHTPTRLYKAPRARASPFSTSPLLLQFLLPSSPTSGAQPPWATASTRPPRRAATAACRRRRTWTRRRGGATRRPNRPPPLPPPRRRSATC